MATYNAKYISTNSASNVLKQAYDNQIQSLLTGSIYTTTADSTMPWRQGENTMNIKAGTVRVKAGYLAQVYNESIIVWESKKAYKAHDKAMAVAKKKINKSIDKLFNK